MEVLLSVDSVLRTGTVAVPLELVNNVESALASAIAVVVVAMLVGRVASVRSGGPRVLVSLLKIHLWAERFVDVGVTIVPRITSGAKATVPVLAGHLHGVEGIEATALELGNVDIPLNGATKEVGFVEIRIGGIERGGVHNESTVVHVADVALALRRAPVRDDVLSGVLAIDVHGDGSEVSAVDVLLVLKNEVLERRVGDVLSLNGDGSKGSDEGAHSEHDCI